MPTSDELYAAQNAQAELLYSIWLGRLKKVVTSDDAIRLLDDFRRGYEGNSDALALIDMRLGNMKAMPKGTPLAKQEGNYYLLLDMMFHHVLGLQRSFDPTWGETFWNGVKAGSQALYVVAEKGKNITLDTADAVNAAVKAGKAAAEKASEFPTEMLIGGFALLGLFIYLRER